MLLGFAFMTKRCAKKGVMSLACAARDVLDTCRKPSDGCGKTLQGQLRGWGSCWCLLCVQGQGFGLRITNRTADADRWIGNALMRKLVCCTSHFCACTLCVQCSLGCTSVYGAPCAFSSVGYVNGSAGLICNDASLIE